MLQENSDINIDREIKPDSMVIPIVKKPKNPQTTEKISEFSGLKAAKPFFRSMPNIKMTMSGGDGDVPRQSPVDASLDEYRPSPILLPNYAGPQMRRMIAIVNAAVMAPAASEAKSPVPASLLPQHYSGDDPTVSAVQVIGPPVRRCVSLPNIKISETSAETEIEILADDYSYDVAQEIVKNEKRRSLWKRTKRVFRRLVCCCA